VTDRIEIRGLKAMGKHGVRDFEKDRPQPFIVDLVMDVDTSRAGKSDDLEDTVSYSTVVKLVADIIAGEHSDLLEHLAERIAQAVLAHDDLVQAVDLTVRKPHAMVSAHVTDVGVRIVRGRG
jgi:dihydroneopterin aldolase/2-amino-4-hydroxy-6-hydroxymethyldihydropteridine diphosphokinase